MTGSPQNLYLKRCGLMSKVFGGSVYDYVNVPFHQPGSMFEYGESPIYLPAAFSQGIRQLRMRDHCHHSSWGLVMNMEYHGI